MTSSAAPGGKTSLHLRHSVSFPTSPECHPPYLYSAMTAAYLRALIVHFTVGCMVALPLSESEARGDLSGFHMLIIFSHAN